VRAHVVFLADDLLAGREPGTDGYNIAANYVAAQFEAAGLPPAGDNGSYFQTVPLRAYNELPDEDSLAIYADGRRVPGVVAMDDYVVNAASDATSAEVRADVVYVGFGVVDEVFGRDDYADVDVDGKIVAILTGVPPGFSSEIGAFHRSSRRKARIADAHGAVGIVWLPTLASVRRSPWEDMLIGLPRWSMTWMGPDGAIGRTGAHLRVSASFSQDGAAKLFEGAPVSYADIVTALEDDDIAAASFALPVELEITSHREHEDIISSNVVGILEGSDPVLKNEYVVLSAHLDHLGTHERPDTDDRIYNGALDNAAGIASILEVARAFSESGRRPKRSLIFLAVTAEEKGLVGSDYFAHFPTRPITSIVANVNLDMPVLLYDFTDVIAFGAERSTIGEVVERALAPMGVALSPDPMPHQAVFVRSDHYNFVRQGVPAVFLATGYANGGEEAWGAFFAERYHKPSDDLSQDIDWQAGAKFALANYRIVRELANAAERPLWRAGDYFGTRFDGPMEEVSA